MGRSGQSDEAFRRMQRASTTSDHAAAKQDYFTKQNWEQGQSQDLMGAPSQPADLFGGGSSSSERSSGGDPLAIFKLPYLIFRPNFEMPGARGVRSYRGEWRVFKKAKFWRKIQWLLLWGLRVVTAVVLAALIFIVIVVIVTLANR